MNKFLTAFFAFLEKNTITLFLLIGVCLVLNLRIFFGEAGGIRIHDTFDSIIPRAYLIGSGLAGYWIPQIACGIDAVINTVGGIIPIFLYGNLSSNVAYSIINLSNFILLATGTYFLCKKYFPECTNLFAFCAACLAISIDTTKFFMFGFFVGMFPYLILSFEYLKTCKSTLLKFFIALGMGILFAASFDFILFAPFAGFVSLLWFLAIPPTRNKLSFWFFFSFVWFIVIIINLDTIWSILSLTGDSHRLSFDGAKFRSEGYLFRFLMERQRMLAPAAIGFVTLAVLKVKNNFSGDKKIFTRFVIIYALIAVVLPLLALTRPPSLNFFGSFARIVYACYSLGGIVTVVSIFYLSQNFLRPTRHSVVLLVLLSIIACIVVFEHFPQRRFYFSFAQLKKQTEFVTQEITKNNHDDKKFRIIWRAGHPSYANYTPFETADGYVNLYPLRYKKFWEKVITPLGETTLPYFKFWGSRIYLFSNDFSLPLLSIANVRYIVTREDMHKDHLTLIAHRSFVNTEEQSLASIFFSKLGVSPIQLPNEEIFIYENSRVIDRFFFPQTKREFAKVEDLFDALQAADYDDLKDTLYVEDNANIIDISFKQASVDVLVYSPDRIELKARSDGQGVLVITNQYSKYWRCTINGQPTEVFPTYGTFQGVNVGQGEHLITLEYSPPWKEKSFFKGR